MKLKDGSLAAGKRILIDGQQRVTALMAALLGHEVVTKNYARVRIRIAFHPGEEKFEVSNPAIQKNPTLSQADFAMSKIATNETYGSNTLRKAIDYFCHLAVAPHLFGWYNFNHPARIEPVLLVYRHLFSGRKIFGTPKDSRRTHSERYGPSVRHSRTPLGAQSG